MRQRRRRAIWLGAAASVVLLALGTLGAAYSPLFGVEKVSVVGAQQLAADDISDALASQLGTPLPLVDESAVKAALVAFPLIETYALEARPPHELVVRIVERTPIGLIETRAGYTLVDAAGVALSTAATPSAGVPVLAITGGIDSDAFVAAGQVMRALPDDIRAQVTEVTASTPDDVTLTLGGSNAQVVWGSAERVGGQGAEPREDDGPASTVGRHDLRRDVARGRRRPLSALRRRLPGPDAATRGLGAAERAVSAYFRVKELHTGQFFIPLLEVEGLEGPGLRRPA